MPTRRDVLASVGSAMSVSGALAVGTLATTGTATAYEIPETVTISYEPAVLEAYRPKLYTNHLAIEPTGLYAWTARSPDRDTDAHVYWAEYAAQRGVTSFDSHLGDHEPVIVFADSETGAVAEVVMSVYHWLRGRFVPPSVPIIEGRNPALQVARPWHHYRLDPRQGINATYYELRDLREHLQAWLDNGLDEALYVESTTRPWTMAGPTGRAYWWQDIAAGISVTAEVWRLLRTFDYARGSYR